MLPVNGNVNAMPRKISCKLEIGGNTITSVKTLTYASDWSGDITIGQVVSSYISATIPTPSFSLTGANVAHSMGIGSPAEWVDIGQYRVDENSVRNRQGYTSFSAYDKLHNTVNTYYSALTFPATLQAICDEVCSMIGITSTNIGINFTVTENILDGYTSRDVLGFVAAMCGKNAYLSPTGQLELRWFTASGYTADNTRANVPYIGENNCTVNRLICQSQDGTLTSGSGQGIYFTCPIMTQDWLDWLQGNLSGFSYRKADVDIPYGNFCIQSGDIITVTTTGSSLTVPVMANSWTYDGGLSSAVSAYGVSDYSGTANNAERSVSARRVQGILDTKRAVNREQQQYTSLQGEIQHAANLITGATGGHIRINFDGTSSTPAEILVMDTDNIATAQNVWAFNQSGIGHFANGYGVGTLNLALTMDGHIVAERIAGNKISVVKLETFYKASSGLQSHIMIEDGTYTVNKCTVDSSGEIVGTPTFVGDIAFEPRSGQSDIDTFAIHVAQGGAFTIGTKTDTHFFYYSDYSTAPSGATRFGLFGDVSVFGDVKFNSGATDSLNALKATVDSVLAALVGINAALVGINAALDDLDRRVTALENA